MSRVGVFYRDTGMETNDFLLEPDYPGIFPFFFEPEGELHKLDFKLRYNSYNGVGAGNYQLKMVMLFESIYSSFDFTIWADIDVI